MNRIIRMKALAWNMLCTIIRYVPNLLMNENLNINVSYQ